VAPKVVGSTPVDLSFLDPYQLDALGAVLYEQGSKRQLGRRECFHIGTKTLRWEWITSVITVEPYSMFFSTAPCEMRLDMLRQVSMRALDIPCLELGDLWSRSAVSSRRVLQAAPPRKGSSWLT
jgi:hypothetical protein